MRWGAGLASDRDVLFSRGLKAAGPADQQGSPVLFQSTDPDLSDDAKLNQRLGGEVRVYFWLH